MPNFSYFGRLVWSGPWGWLKSNPHLIIGGNLYIIEDFYCEFGKMIKRGFIRRDITHREVPKHMTSAHDNSSICIIWHGCKLVVYCLVSSYSYIRGAARNDGPPDSHRARAPQPPPTLCLLCGIFLFSSPPPVLTLPK